MNTQPLNSREIGSGNNYQAGQTGGLNDSLAQLGPRVDEALKRQGGIGQLNTEIDTKMLARLFQQIPGAPVLAGTNFNVIA